ncbi:MAG: C69 family dipeptidase [Candidatus Heimdallarchaeaceae archaeon]
MCDTVVAVGKSTKDGSIILGKNSNRVPNEVHNVEYVKGKKHEANAKVKCTYITIPQAKETYDVLLLKPFWMFGCEMGSNEFGVTMGNEAVYSKEPIRDTGLLGMDLMRLALERSKTAKGAIEIITNLLEKHGQGGQCTYNFKGRDYHNSFIIADTKEAWVLETADRFWIAEKVKGIRTISNILSIGREYDLIHPELIDHAINKGYCKNEDDFHFADNFRPKFRVYHLLQESQPRSELFAKGFDRQQCTTALLLRNKGKITPEDVMEVLRNHNIKPEKEATWSASKAKADSPCHHATGYTLPDQTTGSLVSHLKKDIQVHWVTGTSSPCTSTFKPVFLPNAGFSKKPIVGDEKYNDKALWWQHEKLHRLVLLDYQKRLGTYKEDRDKFEKKYVKKVNTILKGLSGKPTKADLTKMKKVTADSFKESQKLTGEWINNIIDLPIETSTSILYRRFWNKYSKADGIK